MKELKIGKSFLIRISPPLGPTGAVESDIRAYIADCRTNLVGQARCGHLERLLVGRGPLFSQR